MKTISLLIPLYNSARYLDKLAIDINSQTRPFDEVLFYDDCSQDDTILKAEKLGFHVIKGKIPKRQSAARNILLQKSQCDFIHFHDHDDPIHPAFVSQMMKKASRNSVAICDFNVVRQNSINTHSFDNAIHADPYKLVFERFVHLNAMVISRELAVSCGGFDEYLTLCEEKEFLFKLIFSGGGIIFVPHMLAEWKIQSTSFMQDQGWIKSAQMLRRFIVKCASKKIPSIADKITSYSLRRAWDYFYSNAETIKELDKMFDDLSNLGYYPKKGLGRKMEFLASILGPKAALRVRHLFSKNLNFLRLQKMLRKRS